jgi:hypothetical protein
MQLTYSTSTIPGKLRTIHSISIDGEKLTTTKAKEILLFAKPKIYSKYSWKALKNAVRLGESLTISGGGLFDLD